MNDEAGHHARPRSTTQTPPIVSPAAARVTGVQLALGLFDAQLEALRRQLGPRELAVTLDLWRRRLDRELERHERALARWAA
jgi:hypothetical protein